MIDRLSLHTVCQEARCPNLHECWGRHRTATFMILGDVCTRRCSFCAVGKGTPLPIDPEEPRHVAEAVRELGLRHAVVTSVNRDDRPDGGASHFAETIEWIRLLNPECAVEVLIPDFEGNGEALRTVMEARPDVLNHNLETVPRLYPRVRPVAVYEQSLELLERAAAWKDVYPVVTKSGIMVGVGETEPEIHRLMDDLRGRDCDVLTIGQYLQPTVTHNIPVERYYTPEEFARLKEAGLSRGFHHVESGAFVRSSYHAHEHVPEDSPARSVGSGGLTSSR
jgi:lipoic acid synthetase